MNTAEHFSGGTFSTETDGARLTRQLDRVQAYLRDGSWRTLEEVQEATGGSQAGISARLRDLRKVRFGGYLVEKRRRGEASLGVWEYRLVLAAPSSRDRAQRRAPLQFQADDMRACLTILRYLYPSLSTAEQGPMGRLGKWLATQVDP